MLERSLSPLSSVAAATFARYAGVSAVTLVDGNIATAAP
jgi:hypothetical protein